MSDDYKKVDREDQSRERLHRLVGEAQAGSDEAKAELVRVMRPMILGQVNKINTQNMYNYYGARTELIQAGFVGLMEAIRRFDDSRERTSFWSLAYWRIRHEISEWLAKNAGGIPMPRSAWRKGYHIDKAEAKDEEPDVTGKDIIERARSSNFPIFEATELPESVRNEDDEQYIIGFFNSLREQTPEQRLVATQRFVDQMGWPDKLVERILKVAHENFD